ncbi:DNA replication ATP-dependent helicase/nuclease JHS1 isoform X5 [Populus trichocarpa]|uniref:DNA replication ATP-dependent helicase/nuclease JHS1 isoform X5 n=1 Tax=Populus trichocarpa TaxID=3694 RepID=UPI0022799FF0|nr:DNA replication ATP-dependent helicase/nuclease JHS1 isoform X5 [Populus trichocarpa]
MPPKKKSKSSSSSTSSAKKNHQNSQQQQQQQQQQQPSKFGIQHFFNLHTQNALSLSQNPQPPPTPPIPQTLSQNPIISPNSLNPKFAPPSNSHHLDADDNVMDVSPEITKSVSLQRFKFSPGMLIKQSQDDGGDEVTWKISPVSERLQAVSKQMPQLIQLLAETSKLNSFSIRPCSSLNDEISSGTAGKVDKQVPSPPWKGADRSLVPASRVGLKRINPRQDVNLTDVNCSLAGRQSPFRTPPSLSYCHEKLSNVAECNGASDQLDQRQHKKALLELLDQVEDAISVEDSEPSTVNSSKTQDGNGYDMPCNAGSLVKEAAIDPPESVAVPLSNYNFLVLEVSEKHRPADLSGAQCPYKVLRLLNEQSGEERTVYLWEEWFYSVISPGDTVNVIGEFDDQGKCDVDRDNNLLIVHPDILVSGTRVAASFSCPRRTVLDERLKCSEHSTAALIGTLLHQIFQAGLMQDNPTINFLEEYARIVLQKNIESLHACGVNENDIFNTLVEAIPKLINWINLFKDSQDSKAPIIDFGPDNGLKKLSISEVIDIEEMAWAPKYGLKGMIDASVRVKVESGRNKADEKIVPLEFKTGKVSNGQSSMEHVAQVILYTLLMSERYLKHIDSGLLYYLQSDQTRGITVQRSDVVGLIMRRNELANDILKASRTQQLPPMLQSLNMCRSCRHLDVCTIYHKVHGGSKESSGLGDLFDSHVHHLTTAHYVFLRRWDQLIDLEAKETQIISTKFGHQTVASGFITDISRSHVSVSFPKHLRLPGSNSSSEAHNLFREVWQIDKDEFMTSFSVMRFNLVQLFLQSEQSSHLRKMIVDLEAPRFDSGCIFSQDPALSYIWSVKNLNGDQRRAILKTLTAKDYALILGMPGTGKTSTLVHAVKAMLMRGASILLTSYTNSAIDNLLIKLKAQGIDFLRIGRHEVVHEEVRANCVSAMDVHSVEDIKLRLEQVKVVAVTCLGISSPLLANKKFDVCIMDEAGQITLPIALGPLMFASKFVLVGDHYQLPPLVQSTEARENGMGISLFCRLSEAHPQAISALQSQYRMCQDIMELSNALIYGDRLRCGSSEIANARLKFSGLQSCSSWLKEVLNPGRPVIFINTDMLPAYEAKDSKTVNNPIEAYIVAEVTKELLNNGIVGDDIGIITPYNSQANLIRASVNVTSVEIHTIDKYQGRDKECILVSFARSSENPRNCTSSLLGDWHRINVALTRAKKKLILVGSCKTLSKVPLLKLLVEKVEEQSGIINVSKTDINYEEHKGELKRCSHIR